MNEIKKISVLYAEDEQPIREKYIKYLKRFSNDVYEAKDGEEAFQIYKEKRPDIILCDIEMPKMSGFELVSKIRENDHNTKVIMLTAHSDVKYLLEATKLKLTRYLIKPVNREDLKQALYVAIEELSEFNVFSKKIIYFKENYQWNSQTMELFSNDGSILLTKNEKSLIHILSAQLNTPVSYEDIIYEIWPDEFNDKLPALKTLVKSLRKKLPQNSIENIRSTGYKMTV